MKAVNEFTKLTSSWFAVVLIAVFTVISQLMYLYPLRGHDTVPRGIRFAIVGLAAIVGFHAFARRNRWNKKLGLILFLLIVLPFYVIAWVNHAYAARGQEPWVPFEGFWGILLVLAVAVLRAKYPEAVEVAELLSRATDRIIDTNALLSRFGSRVTWPETDLMTDEELLRSIEET